MLKKIGDYSIFTAEDNSSINELRNFIDIENLDTSYNKGAINLGIYNYNNELRSSNYVGICRLKDRYGRDIKNIQDGTVVILKIEPRFDLSVIDMLNYIRADDEFERYLAPQTIRKNQVDKEVESLEMNELFHFFNNEAPIKVDAPIARDSSLLTVTLFLAMLKDLCRRPLMGKMVKKEENLVGKVKGKIVFDKNIRENFLKGRNDRIYCEYLEFSQDILENQVLKAALVKAKRFILSYFKGLEGIDNNYNRNIVYCSKVLEHISSKKIASRDCESLKLNGVFAYYKPVINLAKMVLGEISLDADGKSNTTNYVIPYAISMEKLFEVYVRAYLKNNGIVSYKTQVDGGIQLQRYDEKKSIFENTKKEMANYIGGSIKPDLIFKDIKTGEIVVFDVKYKSYDNKRFAREDRLQLLAYAFMYKCSHVGLIFPTLSKINNEETDFTPQVIQSLEERTIKYHQLIVDIKKLNCKQDNEKRDIAEYIKQLI